MEKGREQPQREQTKGAHKDQKSPKSRSKSKKFQHGIDSENSEQQIAELQNKIKLFFAEGNYTKAAECCSSILAWDGTNQWALEKIRTLMAANFSEGKYMDAADCCFTILSRDSTNKWAHDHLRTIGDCYFSEEKYKEAARICRRVLHYDTKQEWAESILNSAQELINEPGFEPSNKGNFHKKKKGKSRRFRKYKKQDDKLWKVALGVAAVGLLCFIIKKIK